MMAVGRGTQLLDTLSAKAGMAEQASLAVGLAYLGLACRREPALPRSLAPIAWLGSVLLTLLVIIPWLPFDTGHTWDILGLAVGVIIAPVLVIGLGLHLSRELRGPAKELAA
jgi:hypothetical protein